MANHDFSFAGGDRLRKIGASWFVSYAYYEHNHPTHLNWQKVKTYRTRLSTYRNTRKYHMDWLKEVLNMDFNNLSKNTIGLSAKEVIDMAKKILLI